MLLFQWFCLSKAPCVGLFVHIGLVFMLLQPGLRLRKRPAALIKEYGLDHISNQGSFESKYYVGPNYLFPFKES